MKTSVIGYPRIGADRELKFASEKFFKGEVSREELEETAKELRATHINSQSKAGIKYIPSNDFSFYDNVLDVAVLLNAIPAEYKELGLTELETYFAMARGYQGDKCNVKALAMKKWFNTNYHYLVPEIEDDAQIELKGTKPFEEFEEAKSAGIITKPVVVGPFTFLKLARFVGTKGIADFKDAVVKAYIAYEKKFAELGAEWIQFDEPYIVRDLDGEDIKLFAEIYNEILESKGNVKVSLQTYFGDVRDIYNELVKLPFDGIGLDFVEGRETLRLVKENGFLKDKVLFAGVVNGKNIWRNNYAKTIDILNQVKEVAGEVVISTSCSLLHVPYTTESEQKLSVEYKKHFAYAVEKLGELADLEKITEAEKPLETSEYIANKNLFEEDRQATDAAVQKRVSALKDEDFVRLPAFEEREKIQKEEFKLPLIPTTTIGSFPQTKEVRANRSAFKKGEITQEQYEAFNKEEIAKCVKIQEEIGLDVLVHGEYERNDMVEYFGENLKGFLFTQKAWVQSYGTRCVKPPIIWGDVSREKAMTVEWSKYAQSLTDKPMKGMLTGPVTILNWSFPREDVSFKESTIQIACAIRDEVLDLEANGIKIIQVDEAALREKLPLRRSDWDSEYLSWAIPAFRLVHSGCSPKTQVHTHMCYSEFTDIIPAIDDMDADVITFEASRSDLLILDSLKENNFRTEVGPGLYDIHSPRVPSTDEMKNALKKMLEKIPVSKLWANPDCGLKTRGWDETVPSLKNMVEAAKSAREEVK